MEQSVFVDPEPADFPALLAEISALQADVRTMNVPWTFFDEVYLLQTHITYVEQLIRDEASANAERDI